MKRIYIMLLFSLNEGYAQDWTLIRWDLNALWYKHHKVHSLVKSRQKTLNSGKYELLRKCQITLTIMKSLLNE